MDDPALVLVNREIRLASDLRRWLDQVRLEDGGAREAVALRLPDFVELREALRQVFEASIGGGPFPAAAVERLNETSARVPRVLRLEPPDAVEDPLPASPPARLLAGLAWSAIDLVGTPRRERLRRCEACGRFFEASRSDRRWCSLACGNRTRVARHHARRRAGSA